MNKSIKIINNFPPKINSIYADIHIITIKLNFNIKNNKNIEKYNKDSYKIKQL